jgi:hypothetical protein
LSQIRCTSKVARHGLVDGDQELLELDRPLAVQFADVVGTYANNAGRWRALSGQGNANRNNGDTRCNTVTRHRTPSAPDKRLVSRFMAMAA